MYCNTKKVSFSLIWSGFRSRTLDLDLRTILFPAFCRSRNTLFNLCSLITGDAHLYSMFRLNAQPVHCPFKPPMTFTYNRGHGECRNPVSTIESCIEESRLVLRFQACPDVSGTESAGKCVMRVEDWNVTSSIKTCLQSVFFALEHGARQEI